MPTTPSTLAYNTNKQIIGPATLWANLALPGAGARMVLDSSGTPDATTNPSAVHLGNTAAGLKIGAKATFTDLFVDESIDPIRTIINTTEAHISGDLVQVADISLLQYVTPGQGTYSTGGVGTYNQLTGGTISLSYTTVAVIAPSVADPTKFEVFMLYKAINTTGFDIDLARKTYGKTPFNFKGYAITSRAQADTTWNRFQTI